jgi:hypothetical protein
MESASFTPPTGRFVQVDGNEHRVFLPPPGFGAGKKSKPVKPEPLTFCRKKSFKKPDMKLSGISLAVEAEKEIERHVEEPPRANRVYV